jgi:Helicase HerA, central domain
MSDEKVGIVGSPSTTVSATVDIVGDASAAPLHGQLAYLTHPLGEKTLIALGTVTEIQTSNRWHEDANMRGVLKRHGSLPHLSEVGDVRTADLLVQAAYEATSVDPSVGDPPTESGGALSMSPTTGSPVIRVSDEFLSQLLRRHASEITYLGTIHRSDVRLPLKLRHFGPESSGGSGEAYHLGIFGMTGSGKSALASYLIATYARHTDMGILVMDPQGQFTTERGLPFSLRKWAREQGRSVLNYSISRDLRLARDVGLLGDLLEVTPFFKDALSVKATENRITAGSEFARTLRAIDKWDELAPQDVLRRVLTTMLADERALVRIYASQASRDRLVGAIEGILGTPADMDVALETFAPLHNLFAPKNGAGENRKSLWGVLQHVVSTGASRPLVLIDFSGDGQGEELLDTTSVKARLLRIVCSRLNRVAEDAYKSGESLNTLVVFDEAQRFAAQEPEDDEARELAIRLVDYVRTTRKYGLGWMFITQETGSLRRGIYNQLRVRAFGYGLTSGTELSRLRETIGNQAALDLYRSFVDPAAIRPAAYPFMLTGPISPLSFTGAPVFLSVYTDFADFRAANEKRVASGVSSARWRADPHTL